MDTYPPDAWKRLGAALERRRAQLGYGYRQREDFLRARGGPPPSVKTIGRIERGERAAYPESTISRLEQMYGVEPGSFEAVLRGGELAPSPGTPSAPLAPGMSPSPADGEPDSAFRAFAADEPEPGSPEDRGAWALFPDPGDVALRWLWRTPGATEQERIELIEVVRKSRRGSAGGPPAESAAG